MIWIDVSSRTRKSLPTSDDIMTNDSICIVYHTHLYCTRLCSMQLEIGIKIHIFSFHLINFLIGAIYAGIIYNISFFFRPSTFLPFSIFRIHSFCNAKHLFVVFAKWSDAINYSKIFHATTKWICTMHVSNGDAFQFFFFLHRQQSWFDWMHFCLSLFSSRCLIYNCLKFRAYRSI